jgi:hypothetical protein
LGCRIRVMSFLIPKSFIGKLFAGGLALAALNLVRECGVSNSVSKPDLVGQKPSVAEFASAEKLKAECRSTLQAKMSEYQGFLAAKKFFDAALSLRPCAEALADSELRTLVKAADIKSYLQVINNPKADDRDKARHIELLVVASPEEGAKYASMVPKLIARADNKDRQAKAAVQKKEGVSLGMTTEEVLASSWGRARSINRTTHSWGIDEQWVYGGRSYLYFKNGLLVTIQN